MNLLERARYGPRPGVELLAQHPEVRLVLFSLWASCWGLAFSPTPGGQPTPTCGSWAS